MISNEAEILLDQDDQWEFMFLEMTRFQDREGHCSVPLDHKENGALLGLWLENQRLLRKHDLLPIERHQLLDELGVNWQGNNEDDVVSQVSSLLSIQSPASPIISKVAKRKREKGQTANNSKRHRLQEKHASGEENSTHRQSRWETKFSVLRQFKEEQGHCNVPQTYISAGGHKLGYWLNNQKHKERIGKLDLERKKQLEQLGVLWSNAVSVDYNMRWEKHFRLLSQFKEREGHCNVPQRGIEKGLKLGMWLRTQKQMERIGRLDSSRRERLDELGVLWLDPVVFDRRAHWERMFHLLSQFKEREGHCWVPCKRAVKGLNLGMWLYHQKQMEKLGQLDPKRQERMEKLGVVWFRDQQNIVH